MAFTTYSQNLEDAMLHRAFKQVQQGFYVDVGANHPTIDSVTRAFYDRGWRGINIEPITEWFELLEDQRPEDLNLQLVVSDRAGLKRFYEIEGSGLSTDSRESAERLCAEHRLSMREHLLPALTLTQILQDQQVEQVHFLKIDVEGAEPAVLRGLDLDAIRPWVILVEATEPLSQVQRYADWESLLTSKGYQFVYADGLNRYYLADEQAELKPAFDYPPNVFDEIVPHQLVELHQQLESRLVSYRAVLTVPSRSDVAGAHQPSNLIEYFRSTSDNLQLICQGAQREVQTVKLELGLATRSIAAMTQRIAELEQEVSEAWRVAAVNECRTAEMRRSVSWKVTAPWRECWRGGVKLRRLLGWADTNVDGTTRPASLRERLKRLEQRLRRFRKSVFTKNLRAPTAAKPLTPRARIIQADLNQAINQKKAA